MEALWTAVPLAEGKPLPSCIRSVVTCIVLLSTLFIWSGCVYKRVLDSNHCWFISNLTPVCLCRCLFFKVLKLCLIMFFCTFEVSSLGVSGGSFCSYLTHFFQLLFLLFFIFPYFSIERLRWSSGSVLAFSTQVCGFKPVRSRQIFRAKKSSASLPSEGK